ncbi:hypothetical protein SAMN04487989_102502 [Bizionia echini]|uniref:YD repeat-containing protein n=1 Tax=Bizionia echini TaxID=649333 RepID=A0A1I5B589_9FLAO|nr:hypothetical protein [Bizionia echini]SFN69875.1 hypothetical protein SAMN04487989_102502 [Bizionia echini]
MKNLLASIIILLIFDTSFAQKSENELLKNYDFYVEKNIEMGKWNKKFYLKNGLVVIYESYWKNELRSRTEFKYDQFGNVEREINTFDINEGKVNDTSNFKLEYNDSLLISKEFNFGVTEKYSDFNEQGKAQKITRIDSSKFTLLPYKELIEYDKNGNIIKTTELSSYEDLDGKTITETATTYYKYNDRNNVIEIHREFEPKQEFPIHMTGGPAKYEFEYFRYKYNKNGLWTKKYKTVNGKEYLIAKRKYK